MSKSAGTQSRDLSATQVTRDSASPPPVELPVTTRLLDAEPEPFPYTKVRDWIALLSQVDLPDGAFRLYCVSRSVIWENSKGGPPSRPVTEITYEEYGLILGRSAKTISRLAAHLYAIGLWEEIERTSRSVKVPGKSRPEVRTVLTIRVHDYPHEPWAFDGPVKTWDVLSEIRATRKRRDADPATDGDVSAGQCDETDLSGQSQQQKPEPDHTGPESEPGDEDVSAGHTGRTDLSAQSDQDIDDDPFGPDDDDPFTERSSAQTPPTSGECDRTNLSEPGTNLSEQADVSAGQSGCDVPLKKRKDKEEKTLPPTPSTAGPATLDDELAMFSVDAIELVTQLYARAMSLTGAQPLSATDRVGLARRIDARLTEGWSLTRIRAVLNGGSLDGVRMPGRLWAARLDDMPAFPKAAAGVPVPRDGHREDRTRNARPSLPGHPSGHARPRTSRTQTNDCSNLPEPNPGKARYEIPDDRGVRMKAVWADDRTVKPWCGHCSGDTRCLRPFTPGALLRPCPECHPDPGAFPPVPEPEPAPAGADAS